MSLEYQMSKSCSCSLPLTNPNACESCINKTVWVEPYPYDTGHPYIQPYRGVTWTNYPTLEDIRKIVREEINLALKGTLTKEERIKRLKEELDELLYPAQEVKK